MSGLGGGAEQDGAPVALVAHVEPDAPRGAGEGVVQRAAPACGIDRADLAWFFQTYGDGVIALIPPEVPLREYHTLVQQGVELIATEERTVGGGLGRPSGARFR